MEIELTVLETVATVIEVGVPSVECCDRSAEFLFWSRKCWWEKWSVATRC